MDLEKYHYTLNHPELSVDEKRISLVKEALKDFELDGMDSNLIISYLVDFACNYTYFLKKKLNLSDDVRREFFEELGIEEHKIEENKEEFEENKEEISDSDLTAYDIFQVIKITIEQDRIQDNETENN